MAAKQTLPNGGTVIDGATLGADLTYANAGSKLIDLGDNTTVGIEYKTTQGVAAPDHVGVLRFRVTNDPSYTPTELLAYETAIATGAARQGALLLTGIAMRYLEVFYDYTSGGADDTMLVTAVVKRGGGVQSSTAVGGGGALESGGNLDTIAGDTTSLDAKAPALGQALAAASTPVVQADAAVTAVYAAVVLDADRLSTVVDKSGRNLVAIDILLAKGAGAFDAVGEILVLVGNDASLLEADALPVPTWTVSVIGAVKLELETAYSHIALFYNFTSGGADDTITANISVS